MSQTLGQAHVHIVFSTKERLKLITPALESELHAYIGGICKSLKCPIHVINGMPDHVHILLEQHRSISLSELVGKIKANSSKWVKAHPRGCAFFCWQRGYGYFGVGRKQFDAVKQYILNQKKHHQKMGFRMK